MKKYLYIAWVTLFICLLVSSYFFFVYDSSENEFLTNTTGGGIFSFEIMALQNVESGELSLILTGNDGETHSCSNLQYESTIKNEGEVIEFNIWGMKDTEICATSLWPAWISWELWVEVASWKTYTLKLWFWWDVDIYKVSILSDKIKFDSIRSRFSKIENNTIYFINKDLLYIQCFYNGTWYENPFDDNCKELFARLSEKFPEFIKSEKNNESLMQKSGIYTVSNPQGLDEYMDMLFQQFNSTEFYLNWIFQNKNYSNHFCECKFDDYVSRSNISKQDCSLKEEWKCEYKNVYQNGVNFVITSPKPFDQNSLELEYEKVPLSIKDCKSERIISTCITEIAIKNKDVSICENLKRNPDKELYVTEEQCKQYVKGEF